MSRKEDLASSIDDRKQTKINDDTFDLEIDR